MNTRIENNNTPQVLSAIEKALNKSLEESGLLVETAAKLLCPVDTGRLRNSITHQKAGERSEQIGTNVPYGKYVELGTSKMGAQAFLKPSLQNASSDIRNIFKRNFS